MFRLVISTAAILIAAFIFVGCSTSNFENESVTLHGNQLFAKVVVDEKLRADNSRPYVLYRLVDANTAQGARDGIVLKPRPMSRFYNSSREENPTLAVNRAAIGQGVLVNGRVTIALNQNLELLEGACYAIVDSRRQVVTLAGSSANEGFAIGLQPYQNTIIALKAQAAAEKTLILAKDNLVVVQRALRTAETALSVNRSYKTGNCSLPQMLPLPIRPENSFPFEEANAKAQNEMVDLLLSNKGRLAMQLLRYQCGNNRACFLAGALAGAWFTNAEMNERAKSMYLP